LGEFFRQYFFAMDREEMPFNRAERDWVHRAANNTDTTVAFGSTKTAFFLWLISKIKTMIMNSANKPIKKTNSVDKASKTGVAVSSISIMFCVFTTAAFHTCYG
jgi:hypothetical protein